MGNQIHHAGNANSFVLRSLRFLFEDGKSLPQMNTLWFPTGDGGQLPFGIVTCTDAGRLVFWPPLPTDIPMLSEDGEKGVTDHVTLELSNGQSHVTSFNGCGTRRHFRRGWGLHEIPGSGLAQWFTFLVPWHVVERQDLVLEVSVRSPTSDQERRLEEFRKYAAEGRQQLVSLPPERLGDYVYAVFYLCTGDKLDLPRVQDTFLCNIDSNVTGFSDGTFFSIFPTLIQVGPIRLLVAAATPPGKAKDEVAFGFPTKGNGRHAL